MEVYPVAINSSFKPFRESLYQSEYMYPETTHLHTEFVDQLDIPTIQYQDKFELTKTRNGLGNFRSCAEHE